MSKFEAELRLPCKQPYAYISVWIRGETVLELSEAMDEIRQTPLFDDFHEMHTEAYDVVMGTKKSAAAMEMDAEDPRDLIVSELGGKVIEERPVTLGNLFEPVAEKPWERKKPAAPKAADPNDPFANFK